MKNFLKEKKQLLQYLILAGVIVISIILLVVLGSMLYQMVVGSSQDNDRENLPITLGVPNTGNFLDPQAAARSVFVPDIIFPSEVQMFWDVPWIHTRERKNQWSLSDIQQFWYDPVTIGTETLSNQNRERIRRWLLGVE